MPKDIRDIIKESSDRAVLSEGHRERFEKRLQLMNRFPKKNYYFLKIAASLLILLGVGYYFNYTHGGVKEDGSMESISGQKIVSLGSISPEMKQVENYYLTAINYEMASLEVTPETKKVLDAYLEKVALLTADYKNLTAELSEKGIDEKIINALITNLQLRLQLLIELKDTLNELKTTNTFKDEKVSI